MRRSWPTHLYDSPPSGPAPEGAGSRRERAGPDPLLMRVAVISDIHANLPALEAALGGDRLRRRRGDLVPRGRGRLRRPAGRLHRAGPGALRGLPGRQPRPRRARRARHLLLLLGRRRRVSWTQDNIDPASLDVLRELEPSGERASRSASSTRLPATRSGSTCSRSTRPRTACDLQPRARQPDRPLPRRALLQPPPRGGGRGRPRRPGRGRRRARARRGRWLINPGSVGQPRDGDPRAAWLELDTADGLAALPPRRNTTSSAAADPDRRGGASRAPGRAPLRGPLVMTDRAQPFS